SNPAERPVTFVFNGGPGAAPVYLHMGAVGPKRIVFAKNGDLAPPPTQIEDNADSWLPFTDLVFVDPVGTGYSRFVGDAAEKEGGEAKGSATYHSVDGDLKALGQFIDRWLNKNERFLSPVIVAGESYGGFRAAALAKLLPNDHEIPLSGSVMISPRIDLFGVQGHELYPSGWITRVPSYAASAASQGRGRANRQVTDLDGMRSIMLEAEAFATGDFALYLTQGEMMDEGRQDEILETYAEMTGLSPAYVKRQRGRISQTEYARELLREDAELVGIYDATITSIDPEPDAAMAGFRFDALSVLSGPYRAGLISYLGEDFGFAMPERDYESLSGDVFAAWRYYVGNDKRPQAPGAGSMLREGLAMNKHLKVWITHGAMDLQTPYFESAYVINNLGIPDAVRGNVRLDTYYGGHMYYMHPDSSSAFAEDARAFYESLR
ncbi:MAG: septum formation initiator, partial [Pseudomonadota bacterium]